MNPLLFILGRLLAPGTDWKRLVLEQGLEIAEEKVKQAWRSKVTAADLSGIAAAMAGEGWSWQAASDPAFRAAQKVEIQPGEEAFGPGFIISRDAVYSILRESGVPGGATRDGIRDSVDQKVWVEVQAAGGIDETSTLDEVVTATFDQLVRVIF